MLVRVHQSAFGAQMRTPTGWAVEHTGTRALTQDPVFAFNFPQADKTTCQQIPARRNPIL